MLQKEGVPNIGSFSGESTFINGHSTPIERVHGIKVSLTCGIPEPPDGPQNQASDEGAKTLGQRALARSGRPDDEELSL